MSDREMRCEALEEIVFSGREPDAREEAAMQAHAARCEACRALLAQRDVLRQARGMDERIDVPASFSEGWRRAVRQAPRKGGALRGAADWLRGVRPGRLAVRAAAFACCAVALLGVGAQMGRLSGQQAAPRSAQSGNMLMAKGFTMESAEYDTVTEEDAGALDGAEQTARKIVRSAWLTLETDAFDAAVEAIGRSTEQAGGFVSRRDVSGGEGFRRAEYDLSIPEEALDAFLDGAKALGETTYQSMRAEDMTGTYADNASRLESARAQKQRLDELFAQAEDMEDIVTITSALFDVQRQIDSLSGANQRIDYLAGHAQVSLTLCEVERVETGFLQRLGGACREGLEAFVAFGEGAVLFLARALPWLALAGLAAAVCAFLIGRRKM